MLIIQLLKHPRILGKNPIQSGVFLFHYIAEFCILIFNLEIMPLYSQAKT